MLNLSNTSLTNPANLQFSAFSPGYTVDGKRDVGEFIELKITSKSPTHSLNNYSIRYTNTSGNQITLYAFPDGSKSLGEYIILKLARTAESDTFDDTYTTSLALSAGPLELLYKDQVVDQICWDGSENCTTPFKSANPTTLVRTSQDLWEHTTVYSSHFNSASPGLELPPPVTSEEPEEEPVATNCHLLYFSELHSYYSESKSEQFIELYNPSDDDVLLDGCKIRYKNKTYAINGQISPKSYFTFYPSSANLTLTKNPNSSNKIELLDANQKVVDYLNYPHGQKKSTSYALVYDNQGQETWVQTYALTPGAENIFQEYRTCPNGKVINPATGNCVNVATTKTTTVCPAGKYLNPLTGRCKTIEDNSLKPCAEGYERNPETNRCRKITTANQGAEYALQPTTYSDQTVFVAAGVVVLLFAIATIYIIWQFRLEIRRAFRKVRQRFHDIRKNLISRTCRRDRNQKP